MFLKLMSRERGDFEVIEVTRARFIRNGEPTVEYRERGFVETVAQRLLGNAFLLNDSGDTVESFVIEALRKAGT